MPVRRSVTFGACSLAFALALGAARPAWSHDGCHSANDAHAARAIPSNETSFVDENDAAMARMMEGMAVQPTGDVDRDFVAMMVAHHQGAIDMAITILRHGNNEQLKRLAQEIIVTQRQEIVAMRMAIGEPLPPSAPAPTQPGAMPALTGKPVPHDMTTSPDMTKK